MLALGGCATPGGEEPGATATDAPGPAFLVEGRLSVRRLGHPAVIGSFSWGRGYSAKGWTERIKMFDSTGLRILNVISTPARTNATTPRRSFFTNTLGELLARQIGLQIEPRMLAGWLNNEHAGKPLPDLLRFDDTQVEVNARGKKQRPMHLRITHGETIIVVAVTTYSASS